MFRRLIAFSLVLSSLAAAVAAEPDVVHQEQQLERLVGEVRRVVPDGWNVELQISMEYLRNVRPAITITSHKELPVKHLIANVAVRRPDVEIDVDIR